MWRIETHSKERHFLRMFKQVVFSCSLFPNLNQNSFILCVSTDYQSEYYGPGGNYDFFPQGPPSSQAQTPVDLPFVPSSGPTGTPLGGMDHPIPGHHPSSEVQRFSDIMSHHPGDSPSPEPGIPGPLHSMSSDVFGPSPSFTSLSLNGSGYSNHLSHPPSEMNEGTVW